MCGEKTYQDTKVDSVKDATCYYCKQAWGFHRAHPHRNAGEHLSADMFADLLKDSKFEKGKSVPLSELPEELQDNVTDPRRPSDPARGRQPGWLAVPTSSPAAGSS
jgi:hypothetical protein